ncbi:hypothetical protein EGI11_06725 [Chryseobacterium sp. H3056]|uniref:Uncharacterized protein n=1 Tax=Kaistella daneshvariae TaxID=2487074 RepID=A0A3N0WVJ7_9FLAO|nr:hypothetical protein EGI11_06725 [Kaistella daneshvariae]
MALLKALDVVNKNSDQFRAFFAKQRSKLLSIDNGFGLNTRFFLLHNLPNFEQKKSPIKIGNLV